MQKRLPTRTPSSSNGCASGEAAAASSVSSKAIEAPQARRCWRKASAVFNAATRGYEGPLSQHLEGRAGVAAEHFRWFARFVEHEDRHDVAVGLAVAPRQIRSADQERGRERVGRGGVAGDDAGAEHAVGGLAVPRIDDVAVAAAVDLGELLAGAAGADRAVLDPEPPDAAARQPRPQVDRPAAPFAADRQHAAVPGREQRAPRAAASQQRGHPIEREALADGAEVQLHAFAREADGPRRRIELDMAHPDHLARGRDLLVGRARGPRARGSPSSG